MKAKKLILIIVLLSAITTVALGDRELDRTEILQIFQTLTAQPGNTWIPTGTIEASHIEYKASKGYTISSTVIVKYDGDKFYWEINIDSYTREAEPPGPPRDALDLNWNTRRVFAWDGERYTMYFRPGNHAIVTESPSDVPVKVNGPLTAGIIPWGYGMCTLENLSATESSAVVDDQGRIHLTLNKTNAPEIVFVLDPDPAKNYALLSCSINDPGRSSIVTTYGDYEELVSGKWVPTTIFIERYDNSKQTPELLTQDYWDINSISVTPPQTDSFDVEYEAGALVEYYSPITDEPLSYRYSIEVDTDSLLYDRLIIAAADNTQTQNCATVAMKYVAGQLGMEVTDDQLAELINEPNEGTSLYELRQFARELGFYCLAAETDIQSLRNLSGCQAILHLPGPNHYVVLEHIDDECVWVIDLDSDKFYYRTRLDLFELGWSEGTVLLISNGPLNDLEGTFTRLSDEQLHEITGSVISYSNFACTELIQTYDIQFCNEPMGTLCGGYYRIWYNRYGCAGGEDGDYCTGTNVIGNVKSPCILDPWTLDSCIITGTWYSQDMRACQ